MKNWFNILILATLVSCGGGSDDSGGGSSDGGADDEILSGLWLSECIELTGKNYRMYFEMVGDVQKGAFLKYDDADTDCSADYEVTDGPADYDVIDEDMEFSTDNEEIDVSGIADKYMAISYKASGATRYTLLYLEDEDTLFVPGQPSAEDPGNSWAGWEADATIGGFALDHTTDSYEYTKIEELP
jgi:hypothetical protein